MVVTGAEVAGVVVSSGFALDGRAALSVGAGRVTEPSGWVTAVSVSLDGPVGVDPSGVSPLPPRLEHEFATHTEAWHV